MSNTKWSEDDVESLCMMWRDGFSIRQIADELDTSYAAVKMFLSRHRQALGLTTRQPPESTNKLSTRPEFDRAWCGVVPFGHWSITKPWSTKCAVGHVIKS